MADQDITASPTPTDLRNIIDRLHKLLSPIDGSLGRLGEMLDMTRAELGDSSLRMEALTEAAHGFYDHLFNEVQKLDLFIGELEVAALKGGVQ